MLAKPLLADILGDDSLTRGLADPEARVLVEWLVERADRLAVNDSDERSQLGAVKQLCRRGRAIARFVTLWCHQGERGAAAQLAAAERLIWPLPSGPAEPCELMQSILTAEEAQADRS